MRNKKLELGQFFTDPVIARFMVEQTVAGQCGDFLDPAVGMGAFTDAVVTLGRMAGINGAAGINITACEIDKELCERFRAEKTYDLRLIEGDYLFSEFENGFDFIVCNPPYYRFRELPNKELLKKQFSKKYHISMSGYSNLCVYFLIKSMHELKENGRCSYIIPYEFLNSGYGRVIKEYMLRSRMLESIYKFDYNMKLFDEAMTTSCILFLENSEHDQVEFINITELEELEQHRFQNRIIYNYDELDPAEKWLRYFEIQDSCRQYKNLVKLSEFGRVSRGIATGANDFFMLNQEMIERYGLAELVCVPCVAKSPDVTDLVLTEQSFEQLHRKNKKVFLFDGSKASMQADFDYIAMGEAQGKNKTYLTSHRNPWYAIENKQPAPILISAFHRNKIKVVRNEMMVHHLTTFHGMQLHNTDESFINLFFCYLLTPIAQELLYASRREYGEGLDKFEPNDLNNADVLDVRLVSESDRARIEVIYERLKWQQVADECLLGELDDVFRKYILTK